VVKILLEHGADVSEAGTGCGTPLQWAAQNGHTKSAELLLARDADINQKDGAALQAAVSNRHVAMVRLLLDKGADVNVSGDYGRTPLCAACYNDDIEIGRILLDHGADPRLECDGRTAFEIARSEEFRRLLRHNDATQER
jgi:ankyrin repeat protein